MMDARDEQALQAAKLYYGEDLTQAAVAEALGVSRPTVAKLIQHAHDRGWVSITVHDPRERSSALAEELAGRYNLAEVRLAQPVHDRAEALLADLGRIGAEVLDELVVDGMLVGVSWGRTMLSTALQLRRKHVRGVEIIQLKGGQSHSDRSTEDLQTINGFCAAYDAWARTLPLPGIFDSVETKRIVEEDRHIARILALGRAVDLAVFTVGGVTPDSLALNLGLLTEDERRLLLERAVGDACSRFFRADGGVAVPEIDARTVGIELHQLRALPARLLIAGGADKADAIEVALRTGLATHLVIDAPTARRVLDLAGPGRG